MAGVNTTCLHEAWPLDPDADYNLSMRLSVELVPREYIPAVDKGVQEQMQNGCLAGYPLAMKVTLYDGSFHDVDSSEMAFKIAGSQALKKGALEADPALLEPMMAVEVVTPEEYMGDVMGDLNCRRGMVGGMEDSASGKVITADVPWQKCLVMQLTMISYSRKGHIHYGI